MKKYVQDMIDLLLDIHDDPYKLEEIKILGGLQHTNTAQGAVAGLVRYLVNMRDGNE